MDAGNGERGRVVPLGQARLGNGWPCVGDPSGWEQSGWFNCGRLGDVSILALLPAAAVMGATGEDVADPLDPVVIHLTCCRPHVRGVRQWLRARMHPQDDVITASTEFVMDHWGQVVGDMEVPVWAPVRSAV
jgi:hypothetical protein